MISAELLQIMRISIMLDAMHIFYITLLSTRRRIYGQC